MLSRSIATAARMVPATRALRPRSHPLVMLPSMMQTVRTYADSVIKVPQMAESISEGTLKQFSKSIGDYVEQDEEIATIETDKIDVAVNATESGTIKEFLVAEEDTVTVGQDLVRIELGGAPSGDKKEAPKEESKEQPQKSESESKSESKPEPKQESAPEPKKESAPAPSKPEPPRQAEKKDSKPQSAASSGPSMGNREERRVKMNRMRLRIAERLKQSQNTAASLTTFNEVDMSNIMEFRKLYKEDVLKKTGVKLGFMSAFSRACVLAMRDLPAVNASIEGPNGGDTIVYRDYVDISVAVATEKGLVTPVVRNVESMDMIGIEQSIADMGKKARDNKLTIEDMAGGTFTISNGGVFGSLMGTPIINLPQSAVLGLHAIKERPVAVNGKIEIRPMMYLALTYDHRLLDGREAVQFLVKVKEYIEDPRRMLLSNENMSVPVSALFVIDIQKDLAFDDKTEIPHAERIRDAGEQILEVARGIAADPKPVIVFVQHEESPESGPLVKGSKPWELVFENDPNNTRELLVSKNQRDTFKSNPDLAGLLRSKGIQHIVAFGIQSECCVLETCKGALEAGFRVTLLQGAHSTYDTKNKQAVQIEEDVENELKVLGASVTPWQTAIGQWANTGVLG
ncbi:Dihydrolipoyllysine-residue succinyltransferase component of 2-oxoglutarate dehydrogenase complex, mitochondrial [Fusarium oxysporum f. sp. cepae]|uniref:dihydrolipoyllysine-residue succinyltransferase n=1 Tax=Fusarium oxysporum f. sp. cepae TaxID=396571 RepID=A0A3L6NY74_FUSOX|nr:Dihydrolipoyllysine-residue succinyltransferase component of 2-oxoglutarate dehydrogenase complex, mitochondrial [Fusarium oxysporum f. sp. cepae]RKK34851.1 Dihydrolipoyllysine-residue succinyltransferase component of 2-oxoglutarate dehydrogenase complex, mitochondrial [Fusarium oxysporum f. sp. cepae]RKK46070.1 Dihydrolipoyllysine-residue succinyltransferase component of 2-oxoglutarate dehydrogenase complex, mitochondrial [Fusarium oxysporum f. sp. cepae]